MYEEVNFPKFDRTIYKTRREKLKENIEKFKNKPKFSEREVLFSNFWLDSNTASGKSPKDFGVNNMNMYTYNDKVVVATANTTRMPYNMPYNFKSNELYDEMVIVFRGIEYEAIVLDVCGTCTWGKQGENTQRIDIFTTHKIMGVESGQIKEEISD